MIANALPLLVIALVLVGTVAWLIFGHRRRATARRVFCEPTLGPDDTLTRLRGRAGA